jgi:sporulation protein YlmC with PRC-barrel domain
MLIDQSTQNNDQRLVASAVYDQTGEYVGVVVKVNRDDNNQLSLLVQGNQNSTGSDLISIKGASIEKTDLQQKEVYVDLVGYPPSPVEVESLPLWQERIHVGHNRHKVGEISVHKATDVYTIEVPIRSEKLVIENADTGEILTEVGLSHTRVTQKDGSEISPALSCEDTLVRGHLTELKDAINFLEAVSQFPKNGFRKSKITMALARQQGTETVVLGFDWATTALQTLTCLSSMIADRCEGIDLEIWVNDGDRAATYQNWLSRYLRPGDKPASQTNRLREQLRN